MGESYNSLMERIQQYQTLVKENKLCDVIAQSEDPKAYTREIIETYHTAMERGYGVLTQGRRVLSAVDQQVIFDAKQGYDPEIVAKLTKLVETRGDDPANHDICLEDLTELLGDK